MESLPDLPRSMWLETYGPYTPGPALLEEIEVDVAIVGGGFTGLMTAYELRRADPGLSVAVLEAREIGYGSSGRNGSFAMTVVGLGFSGTAMVQGQGLPGAGPPLHDAGGGRVVGAGAARAPGRRRHPPRVPARGHDPRLPEADPAARWS